MGRRCTALHAAPRTGFTLRLSSFSLQRKRSTHEDQSFFALSKHLQPEEKAAQTNSGGRKLRGEIKQCLYQFICTTIKVFNKEPKTIIVITPCFKPSLQLRRWCLLWSSPRSSRYQSSRRQPPRLLQRWYSRWSSRSDSQLHGFSLQRWLFTQWRLQPSRRGL